MNDALDCSKLNGISLHERLRYLDGVETIAAAVALRSQCASIE